MIVKAKGPSGPAKIHSDDPKHALELVQYLRTIGYKAWIEDANGNVIEETVLKDAISKCSREQPAPKDRESCSLTISGVLVSPDGPTARVGLTVNSGGSP